MTNQPTPMERLRMIGHVVRLRTAFAAILQEWPNVGNSLVTYRSILWFAAGWPIVATVAGSAYAYLLASHWKLTAIVFTTSTLIDVVPNSLSSLMSDKAKMYAVWAPRAFTFGIAGWALFNLGLAASAGLAVLLLGLLLVERYVATHWAAYDLWRMWCQFRRRVPITWTIMAGKTDQIQGAGQGSETSLSRGLRTRPYLDHPAMSIFCRIDPDRYRCVGRAHSPPGRNMQKFHDVVDELASDDPFIRSIQLPSFSQFDSYTRIVIEFNRPRHPERAKAAQSGPGGPVGDSALTRRQILRRAQGGAN